MKAVVLTQEEFDILNEQIKEIKTLITQKAAKPEETVLDNADFMKLMKISKRTAQTWRDQGFISFSQIGGKIYYKMSDIYEFLNINYKPSFENKKKPVSIPARFKR